MKRLFKDMDLGGVKVSNRFVFPPIKLAYGEPDGTVTDRQLTFYEKVAHNGPGILILEPVSVTQEGKEHPRQLCIHLPQSEAELKKIASVIHGQGRRACLHLNHAGAASNPMASKKEPKAPSPLTCPASGHEAQALLEEEIEAILAGYHSAAEKALRAGLDAIEIQAGHGYLVSQFLNSKTNKRTDAYGKDRMLFAREVVSRVRDGARDLPLILRISGNEMSPEFGIEKEEMLPLIKFAENEGINALHVGMGNVCFSPPWYFHHATLPEFPQWEALTWLHEQTNLPLIVAGRMGRKEKIMELLDRGLVDMVALGRPLLADPDLLEKWQKGTDGEISYCGYCLQGCLHRVKSGEGIGCNINPEVGQPQLDRTGNPIKVVVAGGGPAGMSAALYMSRRGHEVTLVEKETQLGGQFRLAWQAPGKENMKVTLDSLERSLRASNSTVVEDKEVDASMVRELKPNLLVWATGAIQNIPDIFGLKNQYCLTSLEYFREDKKVKGPRVLVIGAGRSGLEIAEKLGREGYEVVATKRTDPIGSMMEMITKKLTLKRLEGMDNVNIMPRTTVKAFMDKHVDIEQDGVSMSLESFQTVILASGMLSAPGPDEETRGSVPRIEIIGDAGDVQDIFNATQAGYRLAQSY